MNKRQQAYQNADDYVGRAEDFLGNAKRELSDRDAEGLALFGTAEVALSELREALLERGEVGHQLTDTAEEEKEEGGLTTGVFAEALKAMYSGAEAKEAVFGNKPVFYIGTPKEKKEPLFGVDRTGLQAWLPEKMPALDLREALAAEPFHSEEKNIQRDNRLLEQACKALEVVGSGGTVHPRSITLSGLRKAVRERSG